MITDSVSYKQTGFFSPLILDYLENKESVKYFYDKYPTIENFKDQIQEKNNFFDFEKREILYNALTKQNSTLKKSKLTENHIVSIKKTKTFTVTTGHQLNLFSGPLYFLYKIISVINLCRKLKETYPNYNFVPIYWMATEDHDFEEIQYFNFKNKKISWNKKASGPVGRLSTEGLDLVFNEFSNCLNTSNNANNLRRLFKEAYLEHQNLSSATRFLVNELFGAYGLVIIDGDDQSLKKIFEPYAKKELEEQITFKNVTKTNLLLKENNYTIQVNPRECNLFYYGDGFRERIIKQNGKFKLNNTTRYFNSIDDLFLNVNKREFLSGNALLRPMYQEVILPNICYVGGGGELAYWMQLKSTFSSFNVPFPILLLRNSALIISEKQLDKTNKLDLKIDDLFLKQNKLKEKIVKAKSDINFDFLSKKQLLENTFSELKNLASKTDKSFIGAVNAQYKKQINGLNYLEKRLLTAEKRRLKDYTDRTELLQNKLFPNQSLQERYLNFSELYETSGSNLIDDLFMSLNPLDFKFKNLLS